MPYRTGFTLWVILICCAQCPGQSAMDRFLTRKDTVSPTRCWLFAGGSSALFSGAIIGLNSLWYSKFDRVPFQLYNDWGEWEHMDKVSHVYNAYYQSKFIYDGYRWAGVTNRHAVLAAFLTSTAYQGTFEILDGQSKKWGFSIPDILANEVGSTIFAVQQYIWEEQRIHIKLSNSFPTYSEQQLSSIDGLSSTTYLAQGNAQFGKGYFERFFKDYNGIAIWASVNPASFCKNKPVWLPNWLNLAVGYSAENMFGGYSNTFEKNGATFVVPTSTFPRYRQYFLSFDIDLSRIKVKNKLLRTLLSGINIIKIPSPTLEINSLGRVKFHPIYF